MNKENETIEVRPVIGYEGLYEVTSEGEVYSLNFRGNTRKRVKLKETKVNKGYLQVQLSKGGSKKHYYVHRLVAETFIPNPDGKPHIDHINTDKSDNRIENLRWCTPMENMNNPITVIVHKDANRKFIQDPEWRRRVKVANIKSRAKAVYCVELDKVFESASEAARQLGLNSSHISQCCTGKLMTHGGYHFRHIQE